MKEQVHFKKKLLLLIIEDDPWTQKGLYSEVEGHISSEDQNTDWGVDFILGLSQSSF